MCKPHFGSMKITEDVRKYAVEQGLSENESMQNGMEQKPQECNKAGAQVYARS